MSNKSALATAWAVGGYMACSALMLLVNKMAVHYLPAPGFVVFCQLLASAAGVWAVGKMGYIEVEPLQWNLVKKFWIVPAAFLATLFANIKILQHSNVETFIVFRASTPLILSVFDSVFLGRQLPSALSWVCLLGLLLGALNYLYFEKGSMSADSIFWVAAWYCAFCFDQLYIKHITNTVKMTTWGRVFYTNLLPTIPLCLFMATNGEFESLKTFHFTPMSHFFLGLSCLCGVAISYFAFLARASISATYFTVVGNTCKVITVILNVIVWDKHATHEGIMSLGVCLVCAYFYEQAPMKNHRPEKHIV